MKKLIVITLILISSLPAIAGEEKNELELITSGKWYLVYLENADYKKTLSSELKENNWMIFHSDGKHEVMSFSELHFGKWEYLKGEKTIKMTNNVRVSNHEIVLLNENELVLKIKDGEIEILMKFKK